VITPSHPGQGAVTHAAAGLQARFGDRWDIELDDPDVWSATQRAPGHIRVLVAHSPAELAAKIATADTEEP
jgi:hypothetical protein